MGTVFVFVRFLIGGIFGLGAFLALSPALAAFLRDLPAGASSTTAVAAMLIVGAIAARSGSARRAFGWGFLVLALCIVALPLSTMLLAGRVAVDQVAGAQAATREASVIGSTIAAGMMTGVAAIVGFFLGGIFLVIALVLLLGGRRQLILVDRSTARSAPAEIAIAPPLGRAGRRIEPRLD